MNVVINLEQYQIDAILLYLNNKDIPGGYNYLKNIVDQQISSGNADPSLPILSNWLGDAAKINSNDGSAISEFVRGETESYARQIGIELDDPEFSHASDNLGAAVLTDVLNSGGIPSAVAIITKDVNTVVSGMNLPSGAWAGTLGDMLPIPYGLGEDFNQIDSADPANGQSPGNSLQDGYAYLMNLNMSINANIDGAERAAASLIKQGVENVEEYVEDAFLTLGDDIGQLQGVGNPMGDSGGDGGPNLPMPASLDTSGGTSASSSANADLHNGQNDKDPIVLDLSGTGISLTAMSPTSTYFDYTNDGFANRSGWVGGGTGILVLNPNGEAIQNTTQLVTSFAQLRSLDSNGDGVIDVSDAAYQNLKVWVGSGAASGLAAGTGRVIGLADAGIASINLNASTADQVIAGNMITATSTFTLTNGATQEIAAVSFTYSDSATQADTPVTISSQVSSMPTLMESGTLRDLRSAMMGDSALMQLVHDLAVSTDSDPGDIESAVQAILYQWAGVTNIDATSRGNDVNAQRLEVVERYLGQSFVAADSGYLGNKSDPGLKAGAEVMLAWNSIYDSSLARVVLQSNLAPVVLPEFQYDVTSDVVYPIEGFAQAMQNALSRLGAPNQGNSAEWHLVLRAADAARLDMGLPQMVYEQIIASATSDQIGSLAIAVAFGVTASVGTNGQISETGTPLSDLLYAGQGIGKLIGGGGGSNAQTPGASGDTFVYKVGDGAVEIDETEIYGGMPSNSLLLGPGVSASTLTVKGSVDGKSLVLTDGTAGDQITLDNMLVSNANGVQQLLFSDGTVLTAAQLIQMEATGTTGADVLYGSPSAEVFDAKGGNDKEVGGGGNDTFVFNAGYGGLEIDEGSGSLGQSVLQLGTGISESSLTVAATSDGDSLVLRDGIDGDQITLDSMLSSGFGGVGQVTFADGTTLTAAQLIRVETTGTNGDDVLIGSHGDDVFDGMGGADVEYGNGGSDTFVFDAGYGSLEISNQYGSADRPVLQLGAGISESSLTVAAMDDGSGMAEVIITDGVDGDRITLDDTAAWNSSSGIQQVKFADGTVWTRQQLFEMLTTGTTGDDALYGSSFSEVFDGKGGNDYEAGNGGSDTFIFNAGYGSLEIDEEFTSLDQPALQLGAGISASSLTVTSDGSNIILTDGISGDQITLENMIGEYGVAGIEKLQFADGATLSAAQLLQMETTGTAGNEALYGTAEGEIFDGKGGNDLEVGNGGNDTFIFDAGYGGLEISETDDYDYDGSVVSILRFGQGISGASLNVTATADGSSLVLTDGVSGDQITIDSVLCGAQSGIRQVQFADGTTLSSDQLIAMLLKSGTIGNDRLYGSTASDVFDGNGGNDVELGNGGNDTFIFNSGYGHLEIDETNYGAAPANVLLLGSGISKSNVTVTATVDGRSLVLTDGVSGDQVTLENMIANYGYCGIQRVQLADGTTLSTADLFELASTGTSGNDILRGSPGDEVFDGKGGNDLEVGDGGNDTFVFNAGYGQLEIDQDSADSDQSVLRLGAGIDESSLSATATSDGKLVLSTGTNGDQITLDSQLIDENSGVQQIQFADGTTWSAAQLIRLETTGTADHDAMYGTSQAEIFDGKGGNDLAVGNGGNDTFAFNAGYGSLEIDEEDYYGETPDNVLQLGAGIGAASLAVAATADGSGIVLTDGVSGDQITIDAMLADSRCGIQQIRFADGTTLSADQLIAALPANGFASENLSADKQVTQLVHAMATFSSSAGFDPAWAASATPADPTLLVSSHRNWH